MVPIKYTKEDLIKILQSYSSKKDVKKRNFDIFHYASKYYDFKEIAPHFKKDKLTRTFWNKPLVIKTAKSYKRYSEFTLNHSAAYRFAKNNGFLKEIKDLYKDVPSRQFKIYTYKKILDLAKKCLSYTEFYKKYPGPAQQGWIIDIKKFLESKLLKSFKKDEVIKLTQSFKLMSEFRKKHPNEYAFLKLSKLLSDPHLLFQKTPSKYSIKYSDQDIINEALKYHTKSDFALKSRGIYEAALRRKLMNKISTHMKENIFYKEEFVRETFETIFNKKFIKVRPDWLKSPKTKLNLELDGYCEELKIAFEYNGPHHYDPNYIYYHESVVWKDKFKKRRCKELGITLYVFKAKRLNALKKEISQKLKLPKSL